MQGRQVCSVVAAPRGGVTCGRSLNSPRFHPDVLRAGNSRELGAWCLCGEGARRGVTNAAFPSLLAACSKGFKKQSRCKPPVLIPTAVLLVLTCIWAETLLHPPALLQLLCLL